jgi:hypothetical protein
LDQDKERSHKPLRNNKTKSDSDWLSNSDGSSSEDDNGSGKEDGGNSNGSKNKVEDDPNSKKLNCQVKKKSSTRTNAEKGLGIIAN